MKQISRCITKVIPLLYLVTVLISPTEVEAQSRSFLREKIQGWGECKNVALTQTGGDIALYGTNGWASSGPVPKALTRTLNELHAEDELIDDIVLTESGSWIVLHGRNAFVWSDIPRALERRMREMNDEGELITSVTLNDSGQWIIISDKNIAASDNSLDERIEDGMSEYGQLWAAHLTEDGLVLVYAEGYQFFGNVPDGLRKALKSTTMNVFRVKFTPDGAWFIADRYGRFDYTM